MGTCGGNPLMGGRRRSKTRKMRGGNMYSFNQGEAIAPGAAAVGRVDNSQFYNSATGRPIAGGRRRKTRKGGRKSRRKQRGGAGGMSMGTTYASFGGSGERGLANYDQGVVQGNAF